MVAYSRWKYTFLLVSLLLVVTSRMALPGNDMDTVRFDIVSAILVTVAILAIFTERRFRRVAMVLGLPVIAMLASMYFVHGRLSAESQLAGRAAVAVFLTYTVLMIVRAVVTARVVTWDTVVGAFSGYVLIGVIWTQLYCAIDLLDRQAFDVAGKPLDAEATPLERQAVLEYFSFTTLSTVGYGDVSPVSQPARSLATFEALCGQFYLAVLIAGLVGIRSTGVQPAQTLVPRRPHDGDLSVGGTS